MTDVFAVVDDLVAQLAELAERGVTTHPIESIPGKARTRSIRFDLASKGANRKTPGRVLRASCCQRTLPTPESSRPRRTKTPRFAGPSPVIRVS
jgi:hypothetical protein